MASEAQVSDFTGFQCLESGVDGAVVREYSVGIVVVDNFMKLPQVDAIRFEPAKTIVHEALTLRVTLAS